MPPNLPVPEDDGGCSHLFKQSIPDISLQNQDGIYLKLRRNDSFRIVFYCYPITGNPKILYLKIGIAFQAQEDAHLKLVLLEIIMMI